MQVGRKITEPLNQFINQFLCEKVVVGRWMWPGVGGRGGRPGQVQSQDAAGNQQLSHLQHDH